MMNPATRSTSLLRERIIFLGSQVDDVIANQLAAQMLLSAEDPSATSTSTSTRPVARSPRAWRSTTRCSSSTATSHHGMGLAASMGKFLLTAGTSGKRYALPHARIMMHQPSAGVGGTASDIAIQADLFRRTKQELNELQAHHTGQPVEQIEKDSDRDRWFAQEALEYGFVDHVEQAPP